MSSKKNVFRPIAVAAALMAASAFASAQSISASQAEGGGLWFVELVGNPVADGAKLATVQAEQAAFRSAARAAGVQFVERRAYNTLFNGLAVSVSAGQQGRLAKLPGVKALHMVETIPMPTPEAAAASAIEMTKALALTNANIAQNSLGLTGAGVKVGIIDTGIDIDHPAFGGNGTQGSTPFPSARVVAGYDFVGDAFNTQGTGAALIPVPDANPDDCGGHGSHVAGIVGGNGGGIRGVAPNVTFGAYRVFGCTGSTSSDIILAALERALADGMQVINQSLGAGRQWPQYPTAQASARLAKKGVVMVASIGNNGPGGSTPDGLFAAGAPGVGDGVIGVASFDNAQTAFYSNGVPAGYNPTTGSPTPPTSGSLVLARTGTTASTVDACNALPAGSLAGMAVLIRRGGCGFYNKAINAQNAGASAVVLYNNAAGSLNATVAGTPAVTIPVVGVAAAQGATIDAQIAAGTTTLNWSSDSVGYPYGTGGLISSFSSFGLAADLSVKPEVGAPGGSILSAYPLELGGTAVLSGTSMSSPHVAGVAALVLQAIPNAALGRESVVVGRNAPPQINMMTRLMNTSVPKNWSGNAGTGLLDHAFRQGAGMVDAVAAVQAQQFVLPSKIATGESQAGPKTQTLTLRNNASTAVTYTLGHTAGVAAGPNNIGTGASYAPTGFFSAPATVTFSAPTVTVPGNGVATVSVTIAANTDLQPSGAPALPDRSLYGGYITLTPQSGGNPLKVTYAGFKGDYQSTQVLTPTTNGFPWLAKLAGGSFTRQTAATTFTLQNGDIPWFLVHFDHLSRQLKMEALDATTSAVVGTIDNEEYMTRNSTPSGFFQFNWDGTTTAGVTPNGNYVVRFSVLKALGNAANPADWETWTSPTVTIARP